MFTKEFIDRFWNKVKKSKDCWIRMGCKVGLGYNVLSYLNKQEYAHRFSWRIHFGKIPKGKCILHKCDNPPCVNPKHLFIGTLGDNIHDMINKGRRGYTGLQGEIHPDHKLTEKQILKIRNLYKKSSMTQQKIANIFGVKQGHINKIVNRKVWKHI
jgi:predicted XRE-type DNA-binding protein